jgi:hypothetical protein
MVSEPRFPSPWPVNTSADVEDFSVTVPRLAWSTRLKNELAVKDPSQFALPEYLRLHMRHSGWRGRLVERRFVLQVKPNNGAYNAELTVSTALSAWCPKPGAQINVSVAGKQSFGLSRFTRQSGALFGTVGIPVGGAAAAAGTLPAIATTALGTGLIIGGGALASLGAVAAVVALWRTRR